MVEVDGYALGEVEGNIKCDLESCTLLLLLGLANSGMLGNVLGKVEGYAMPV